MLLERRSLSEVREKLVAEIQQMLVDAQLERLCSPTAKLTDGIGCSIAP